MADNPRLSQTTLPDPTLHAALLDFYKAVMAEWAAPENVQRFGAVLRAADQVDAILHPKESPHG